MKITLIGHGYVGQHIKEELEQQGVEYYWITHRDSVPADTTAIINAAGYTGSPNVDACESAQEATMAGNVTFPLLLELQNRDIPVVHISSGCVYTGYKEGGWTEEDESNFDFANGSFYSGTKGLAQHALRPFITTKSYLLRIRMPFGIEEHAKNFLTKMRRYEKLIDYENSLSYVPDVAAVAVKFATQLPEPGIYNVCNPGSSNARAIVAMMGIDKQWFTPAEFMATVVAPRSNCVLNVDKLQSLFPIPTVEERLQQAISAQNAQGI